MAIQNGLHRVHLGKLPPTILMTGTTTQIMLDAAELLHGNPSMNRPVVIKRMTRMIVNLVAFALGCGVAAFALIAFGIWCFVLPPLVQVLAFFTETAEPEA
ncbi:DUF1275 family protein [Rhizobium sp.]|jgi:uncharacterized membrane protein YoaK (UPF0700 family)|uniref:DUF1275 family protein n=1 Tax=Rhizobium sp. TaxID=391 RepID=UPI002AA733D9